MKKTFFFSIALLLLFSCAKEQPIKLQGETQGTYYSIIYYDKHHRDLTHEIDSLLLDFDLTASVYNPHSLISKINTNQSDSTNQIFRDIFHKSMEISQLTNGLFDITVMPLVNAWGFGFKHKVEVHPALIDSLSQYIGYEKILLKNQKIVKQHPNIMIDFNAIAQGYAVDLLGDFFTSKGITRFLIDVGGEVLAKGTKPGMEFWKVGIEQPSEHKNAPRTLNARVALKDMALVTSGNYRKYYEKDGVRYSHTINPKTGYPVKHTLLSATVMAKNTMEADAFATAFMVMGLEKAKDFLAQHKGLDLKIYLIYTDKKGQLKTYMSNGFRTYLL